VYLFRTRGILSQSPHGVLNNPAHPTQREYRLALNEFIYALNHNSIMSAAILRVAGLMAAPLAM
jgi:hypothetical protein